MVRDLVMLDPSETLQYLPNYHYPPYITLAHLFHAPDPWVKEFGIHKQYQIQYVLNGVAEYSFENKTYITRKGDITFHRPGELHEVRTTVGEQYSCISLVFHFGDAHFPANELFSELHDLGNYYDHPIGEKLQNIVTLYHQPGLLSQMECQQLLLQVLADLVNEKSTTKNLTRVQEKNSIKLIKIKNYIIDNFNENIQIKDLEHLSGLSKNYLTILFKKEYNISPMQYLTWLRVQRAKDLAINTNLSISEIAHEVGYADVHTFGKMFKKKEGCSLSEYVSSFYLTNRNRLIHPRQS
ncbi:helix-turn-helix transcriptional regulator [Gracilibacillus kekensis]|uniref:AraC-type DNA-binding protein n=1 Tax=Gracilibacillus kekensis TaxID=1027249 RepID=A0A1M7QT66_9BACI|nr:AraC family transcriptional regulator [Gracilibacillus kekensis]SHN35021.1 AraC-type DNA-binding protein [Gracilibacillus kekensis]